MAADARPLAGRDPRTGEPVIPSPYGFVLLALAVLRTYRLLALDSFPPIRWARERMIGLYRDRGEVMFARPLLADWLVCAWCSGLWYAAGWYGAWLLWPVGTTYAAVLMALSAAAAGAQHFLE